MRHDGDVMHTVGAGNIADNFLRIHVKHHYVGRSRNVDAARLAINNEAIPSPVSAEFDLVNHVIASGCGVCSGVIGSKTLKEEQAHR